MCYTVKRNRLLDLFDDEQEHSLAEIIKLGSGHAEALQVMIEALEVIEIRKHWYLITA